MKSKKRGKNISKIEVVGVNNHGIWLHLYDTEFFLDFDHYPWFKEAKISDILNVKLLHEYHLYWPDLDIDLELESLKNPNQYPLVYKHSLL